MPFWRSEEASWAAEAQFWRDAHHELTRAVWELGREVPWAESTQLRRLYREHTLFRGPSPRERAETRRKLTTGEE